MTLTPSDESDGNLFFSEFIFLGFFRVFGFSLQNFLFLSLAIQATFIAVSRDVCDSKNDRTMNFSGFEAKFNFVPKLFLGNYFYPRARTLQIKNND